jgi:prepilin-type N-terminal cleavage/methylation domain-containing protein/prepilin-type processing-associated H-X9-DG protein
MMPHVQSTPPRINVRHAVHRGPSRSAKGFSLVELLVTIALILVISTIYLGSLAPNRQTGFRRSCEANLRKIYLAQEIYARDHGGAFPSLQGARTAEAPLNMLVPRYTVDREIFICPGSLDVPMPSDASLRTNKISYAYYMGRHAVGDSTALMSDEQVNTNSKSAGDAIFSASGKAPGNNHHQFGGNILFTDGRVERSPARLSFAIPVTSGVMLLNPKQ